ncbi:MAG: 4-alpha-glucanotransferase [Bacteroidia bacterium]|nr:MAG: 4-alpha-glucanotransferase [Bacteroidia bacterium]
MERSSGILLHITSLPGKYGIGTMGKQARSFVDFLVAAGQKLWQILPLGHTGYGDSPYQCFSAFAGNPLIIDLDKLCEQGLLLTEELPVNEIFPDDRVDYGKVFQYKYALLGKAYQRFNASKDKTMKQEFESFCISNAGWLDDYAFFMALKIHHDGKSWTEWDKQIKLRRKDALERYREHLSDEINFYRFLQFLFYQQWLELKAYANSNNIEVIGDLPLYVAFDSADAWANPEIFDFDKTLNPRTVAGVPPDYFSETGQLWGNPIYDWSYLESRGFQWWIDRIKGNFLLYDILRIDHFRGLAAYWSVPADEKTAIKGKWIEAPGEAMLRAVYGALGEKPIIAENLGVITPDVEEMREKFRMPGMKILQFAFDSAEENEFIPHSYDKNSVVYTGTHDNNTTVGWFKHSPQEDKELMHDYFCLDEKDPAWSFIRLAWSTVSNVAIAPLQDILRLGEEARMNFPGKAPGYWTWRYQDHKLTRKHAEDLLKITKVYGRA